MPTTIHSSSIVDPKATLGENVMVGPFCIVEEHAEVGDNVQLRSSIRVAPHARILADCKLYHGAVVGTAPQDLKYNNEPTSVVIGPRTTIREYVTVNRGTMATGMTRIGSDCLLMAYTHVAHDSQVGDHVIIANATQMGGHVHIDDWAIVGGNVGIHQFTRVGAHCMVGAGSYLSKDVPPYVLIGGNPVAYSGINLIGLKRRGFSEDAINALRTLYKYVYRAGMNVSDGMTRAEKELGGIPEVASAIAFIRSSTRGIVRGR